MALNLEGPAQALQPTLTLEPVEEKPYDILEDRDRTVARLGEALRHPGGPGQDGGPAGGFR